MAQVGALTAEEEEEPVFIHAYFSAATWIETYETASEGWDAVKKVVDSQFPSRTDLWLGAVAPLTLWEEKVAEGVHFTWAETQDQVSVRSLLGY